MNPIVLTLLIMAQHPVHRQPGPIIPIVPSFAPYNPGYRYPVYPTYPRIYTPPSRSPAAHARYLKRRALLKQKIQYERKK